MQCLVKRAKWGKDIFSIPQHKILKSKTIHYSGAYISMGVINNFRVVVALGGIPKGRYLYV